MNPRLRAFWTEIDAKTVDVFRGIDADGGFASSEGIMCERRGASDDPRFIYELIVKSRVLGAGGRVPVRVGLLAAISPSLVDGVREYGFRLYAEGQGKPIEGSACPGCGDSPDAAESSSDEIRIDPRELESAIQIDDQVLGSLSRMIDRESARFFRSTRRCCSK